MVNMPRNTLLPATRSFNTIALAAVVALALPGLAAAQGWDWDEDFTSDGTQSADTTCSSDGSGLEDWANSLLDGTSNIASPNCTDGLTWG